MSGIRIRRKSISSILKENFSERYYIRSNEGFAVAERGPLEHYIRVGEKAGMRPAPYFAPTWWKATHSLDHGDFPTAFENFLNDHKQKAPSEEYATIRSACFRHDDEFQNVSERAGKSRNGLLDFDFIRRQSAGLAAPDEICQYMRLSGEGRICAPSRIFDPQFYLDTYRDVRNQGVDPLVHFLNVGLFENRKPCAFLKVKRDMGRLVDRQSFLNSIYSAAELFEVEQPYELEHGDASSVGEGSTARVPANLFLGEPQLADVPQFRIMFDVYKAYMGD